MRLQNKMNKFSIEMLPANEGDCLWIEYGDPDNPHRILIDGGTGPTYKEIAKKIKQLPSKPHFDLLIISHVDIDHVGGLVNLLKDQKMGITYDEIWFDAYRHLPDAVEAFGPVQGETISTTIDQKQIPWNAQFQENAVEVDETADLPTKTLPNGMKLTLLSPYPQQLKNLKVVWKKECQKAGIDPSQPRPKPPKPIPEGIESFGPLNIDTLAATPYEADPSITNGSAIAVLAEYDGKRALLAADAFPDRLIQSINKLAKTENEKLQLDAFKVSHHGSKHNTSPLLIQKIDCQKYLISTNGNLHKHPDREAIARIIKYAHPNSELIFNYQTQYNQIFDDAYLKQKYRYTTTYPELNQKGQILNL
jgi:beta-lactamase superfamily II metal-dependent hydrolase